MCVCIYTPLSIELCVYLFIYIHTYIPIYDWVNPPPPLPLLRSRLRVLPPSLPAFRRARGSSTRPWPTACSPRTREQS